MVSVQPPKYPESRPMKVPTSTMSAVAAKATVSDTRAP